MSETQRSKVSLWIQAVRPFSFTASVTPVLIGAVLAFKFNINGEINWWLFPLIIICSLLLHAATNLISDYYDYLKQVDREGTLGSSGVILANLLPAKAIRNAGLLLFALAFALGMILVAERGLPMLIFGIVGIIGGYFYCGGGGYKYIALGDLLVFLLMGPLMVIGSFFALTGTFNTDVLIVSLPIGFLVTAILHANNLRDIQSDSAVNVKTMAIVLGLSASKIEYYLLVFGAFLSVILMAIFGIAPMWALVVLLSLPPALKNINMIKSAELDKPNDIAMIDIMTAQHHFLFGILLAIGFLISAFI